MTKLLVFILLTVSYAHAQRAENPARPLVESMKILAQQDLSCDLATDCTSIVFGSKACGGPNGYIITSKNNPKMAQISKLSSLTVELENDYNFENGVISTCVFIGRPNVSCIENKCSI